MSKVKTKREKKARRHKRVRAKIKGTTAIPRLSVFRSNRHILAQLNQKSRWHSAPNGVFDKTMYDYFGHWVPQFGIRAIAASIEIPSPSCT